MCGIVGVLHRNRRPVSQRVLDRMTDRLAHRGPDDRGTFVDGELGLGHRRLSIIDLSKAGHGPMMSDDERYVITYNGEVYNFLELRAELEARGHVFRSNTDTEVVLNAYRQWGPQAVNRFNGMFAFGIWDRKERTLFLARDRYGIKPIYVTEGAFGVAFASEVKAFLDLPGFEPEVDPNGLKEYLSFQNFFSDRTLFKNVRLMPPASYATYRTDFGGDSEPVTYWDFDFRDRVEPVSHDEDVEVLDRLFSQAVNRQLVTDRTVGAYLSGGLDSGAITAVAAQNIPNIRSFTVGFGMHAVSGMELGFDEREQAELMSYTFQTEHYQMVLKSGDMERCMGELVWHLEEPRVGQSYPNYYAAKLAGKFDRVVLAGTGGDELFAGYPWRYYRAVNNTDFDTYVRKYFEYWQRMLSPEEFARVTGPVNGESKDYSALEQFRDVFKQKRQDSLRPEDYVNLSLHLEAKTFLHGLLVVEDKLSMAHSLESRVPFLDNDLVDYAQHVPIHSKLANLRQIIELDENEPGPKAEKYFTKTNDGKNILRQVLQRYVPDRIANGVKQGFSAPDATWFKGDSIDFVRDRLLAKNAPLYDYLDQHAVVGLVNEHLAGEKNRRLMVWAFLYLDMFMERFMSGGHRAGAD